MSAETHSLFEVPFGMWLFMRLPVVDIYWELCNVCNVI
jgi:hypothetical protein